MQPALAQKALVIASGGGIGDVLYTTPLLRALRKRYAHLTVLVPPAYRTVIDDWAADDVWGDTGENVFALAERIRLAGFAAAIVTWSTARVAYALRIAGVPIRVGPARRLYSGLFTKRVILPTELGDRKTHWSEIQLNYGRALGVNGSPVPIAPRDAAGDAQAQALLTRHGVRKGRYGILHPTRGISVSRAAWPSSRLAEIAVALQAQVPVPLFISGSAEEAASAAAIARRAGAFAIAGDVSLRGFTALAASAYYVVAMDSGPMHLAAAAGAPTVGIFAMQPDEPDRWRPLGRLTAIVRPSYPCHSTHTKETCPDFACVRALSSQLVVDAVTGLLARQSEELTS